MKANIRLPTLKIIYYVLLSRGKNLKTFWTVWPLVCSLPLALRWIAQASIASPPPTFGSMASVPAMTLLCQLFAMAGTNAIDYLRALRGHGDQDAANQVVQTGSQNDDLDDSRE
jgi:hypothetical protein